MSGTGRLFPGLSRGPLCLVLASAFHLATMRAGHDWGDDFSMYIFEYVRTATEPDDVFVFSKPRALALFTGRPASAPFSPADPCRLWGYLREIGASYVVTGPHEPTVDAA